MTNEVNNFLMGGGIPAAKFVNVGDQIVGFVGDQEMRQQTDYKSKEPMVWPDGNPRMQLVLTLVTEDRVDNDDDGLRKVYVKNQMAQALGFAIREAGGKRLEDGGKVLIKYESNGEASPGLSAPKVYKVRYQLPAAAFIEDATDGSVDFDSNDAPPPDDDDMPF